MNDALIRAAIDAAGDAANRTFAAAFDEAGCDVDPEVRLMLVATRGKPSAGQSHTEVRFAAPTGLDTTRRDKVGIALSSMKAIAPELYDTMVAAIERSGESERFGR
jgi:hypothetical protein